MAKGYWIGRVDVHNDEGYKAYAAANPAILKKFGGKFRRARRQVQGLEGQSRSRNVVIEFQTMRRRWPATIAGIPGQHQVRQPHSIADLIIVEGYDGPQP